MSRDFSTVVEDLSPDRSKTRTPGIHFDLKRFISLRLIWVILIAMVLSVPFAVAGWFAAPDVYTATAEIHFRVVNERIVETDQNRSAGASYVQYVGTELAKLKGNIVLSRVLELPEIQKLPSIEKSFDKLAFLMSIIGTSKSRESELVTVYCTMKSRMEALTILQAVMDVYEKQALSAISVAGTHQIEVINTTIDNRSLELDLLLKRIEELQGTLGAMVGGSPEDSKEAEQYRDKWLAAQDRVTAAENAVADSEEQLAKLALLQEGFNVSKDTSIYDFDIEIRLQEDPRVSSSQSQLNAAESHVALLAKSHRPAHPDLKAANRELESLQANMKKNIQVARGDLLKTLKGQFELKLDERRRVLEDEKNNLISTQQRYDEYVSEQEDNLELASAERARIQQMQEEAERHRKFISDLESQVSRIQLDEQAPARVSIASQPYASPSKDRKTKIIMAAMGMMMALAIGMAFGVLRELSDQQIRSRQDVARISDLPTIASIPHLSEDRQLGDVDSTMLMAQYPNSAIADEYRRILARVLYPDDNAAEISSLLIVSAGMKEGKTSVAMNLAIALEQANRRVLLIDLSALKPDVERHFGLPPAAGLSELLHSDVAREDLIRRTAFENLGVVGPGRDAGSLAGRLASREMMDFMEWADERFDHIIVDTPPLLLMSDAKLLAPAMDGVLFVVGAGKSSLGMVSRCLRDLEQMQANMIGIVINGIRNMRGGYLKKNQSLFYEYSDRLAQDVPDDAIPEINVLDEDVPETVDAEVVLLPFDNDKD